MTKCNCQKCRTRDDNDDSAGAAFGILAGFVFIGLVGFILTAAQSNPQQPAQQQSIRSDGGTVMPRAFAPIGSVSIGGGLSIVGE